MKRRLQRSRQKQINILQTTTRKRHSSKQFALLGFWGAVITAMIVAVGIALHVGVSLLLDHALYHNSHYNLAKIEIEPAGHFSQYTIRQAAGLELGQNLWTLNLPRITDDLEKLPYVSIAKVERHFPDRIVINLTERVPVVKIVGINEELGTRELFYLDRERVVLKPRDDEPAKMLPEVIGLVNAEVEPGWTLDQPALAKAIQILEAIPHISTLNTSIDDIRTIDLSQPLWIRMTTTRDMVITFRLDHIEQQLARLDVIFRRYSSDPRTIHTVDLTPDHNVPITFYE